jgi:Zn-dependent protease
MRRPLYRGACTPSTRDDEVRVISVRPVLRFKVGRIPVDVHFSHVLISLLLAFSFAQTIGQAFPIEVLLRGVRQVHHGLGSGVTVSLWTAMISGSVLVHELGHAVSARLLGYGSTVRLVGLGGLTQAQGAERMPWHHDVLFTLAGPAAGLALGVVAGLLGVALGALGARPDVARYVLEGLLFANIFWTILNLAPIASLDGGRIASAVLTRVLGRRGFLVAQLLSLVLGGAVVALSLVRQDSFMALLFGLLLFRTIANITAYQRGELPLGEAAHPMVAALQQAEQLFNDGHLAKAEQLAKGALQDSTPVGLRSRAHLILGWAAVKSGDGRRAMDHFSQVQGLEVPPHALAAAFSLIGDEVRALPLWAQAAEQSQDATILHEFAGALLRAGREADARRLPGLRPALAYLAAERVHAVRREYAKAAAMAESAFREEPGATLAYNAACDWALAAQPEPALRMLALASQNGFDDRAHALDDPDLASLRGTPGFDAWLASLPDTPREPAPRENP